jgi:hypothetical protein
MANDSAKHLHPEEIGIHVGLVAGAVEPEPEPQQQPSQRDGDGGKEDVKRDVGGELYAGQQKSVHFEAPVDRPNVGDCCAYGDDIPPQRSTMALCCK